MFSNTCSMTQDNLWIHFNTTSPESPNSSRVLLGKLLYFISKSYQHLLHPHHRYRCHDRTPPKNFSPSPSFFPFHLSLASCERKTTYKAFWSTQWSFVTRLILLERFMTDPARVTFYLQSSCSGVTFFPVSQLFTSYWLLLLLLYFICFSVKWN